MNILQDIERYALPPRQAGQESWEQEFRFPREFIGFCGHFPDNPVLPAIVQIMMIRLLWQRTRQPAAALNVVSAKFLRPVLPEQKILLKLAGDRAQIYADGNQAAIFRVEPCAAV